MPRAHLRSSAHRARPVASGAFLLSVVLSLVLALALAACTTAPAGTSGATSTAPSTAATTGAGTQTGPATPTPGPSESAPPVGSGGVDVPAVSVPGVTTHADSSESSGAQFSVRWPQVPGASALSDLLASVTERAVGDYRAVMKPGGVAPPELNVSGAVVVAAGDVAGVRLTSWEFAGADTAVSHATYYGDAAGTWAIPSVELFTAGSRDTVVDAVRAALARPVPTDTDDPTPAPTAAQVLTDVVVRPDGSLLLSVDEGVLGPYSDGVLSTPLPASAVSPWLSVRGRAVVDAVRSGTAYRPGTNPTPTAPAATSATSAATPTAGPAVNCRRVRCIALTFDDGPGPQTDQLLESLAAAKARATFFMLGQMAQGRPETVRRAAALGMEVEDHTWNHRDLRKLSTAAARRETDSTAALLRRLSGQDVAFLRPPYGSFGAGTRTLGYPLVLWDVDTEDWKNRSTAETTRRALAGAHPGAIVLMHDIHPSTVRAVPGIVAALHAKGYALVTVRELLGGPPAAGTAVFTGPRP